MGLWLEPEPAIEPREAAFPRCPSCGAETDTYYRDSTGTIVGCDACVRAEDAWTAEIES